MHFKYVEVGGWKGRKSWNTLTVCNPFAKIILEFKTTSEVLKILICPEMPSMNLK